MSHGFPPGLMISAPRSGGGKTIVALGLLRAFARDGLAVQPFKSGPDYIDPAFQAVASGRASFNLDSWTMDGAMLDAVAGYGAGADLVIAEGAMGLFDGAPAMGEAGRGASADIAARMGWPVVLVMDVSGQSQTAAALVHGLRSYRADVRVAGVILNRVASARHERHIRAAMAEAGIAVFGALPFCVDVVLPERHLGLVQAMEQDGLEARIDRLATMMREHVDLAALRAAAGGETGPASALRMTPPGQRVAVARDAAFSFLYPHLLSGWRAAGAEVLPFSPLADEAPDAAADCLWLPGGYPELHAGVLASAGRFLAGLRDHALTRPVHGECGGYMVLGEAIIDAEGRAHGMAGLLGLVTSFAERRLHLGYRRARLLTAMPGFAAGAVLRGHEFHYSTVKAQPDEPLAVVTDAEGEAVAETGARRGCVTGSFFHLVASGFQS